MLYQTARKLVRSLTPLSILILAAGLRFYRLGGQSLWADEGSSVALARRGFVEIAQRTAFDIHPPFYYWLLKIWMTVFGDSEIALRSLSVVLGISLVYFIGILGTRLFSPRVGLIAAFIAAFSPLQIYYAQEARMYMLLAVLGSITVLAALFAFESYSVQHRTGTILTAVVYVLTVTAGLYTHYAYPLVLVVVNVVALYWFRQLKIPISRLGSPISTWFSLQLVAILLYAPWLPIAWRQVTTWPSENQGISLVIVVERIAVTLLFGLSWPFETGLAPLVALGLVLLVTLWIGWGSRNRITQGAGRVSPLTDQAVRFSLVLLWLWILLPVALTTFIFSPAFLKFLLVAAPPLALLVAVAVTWLTTLFDTPGSGFRPQAPGSKSYSSWLAFLAGGVLLTLVTGTSALSLYYYYTDPAYARDNYRAIVNFIKAVGGPDDAIILNAEGQQDVFDYYYRRTANLSAPVHPLPRRRPLDKTATLNELKDIAGRAGTIYAVYWAARQADPQGLIEGWLDGHLVKAMDQWYGNVRLVSYATPRAAAASQTIPVDYELGDDIRLTGYALSTNKIRPGEILQVTLVWKTDRPVTENYAVFVQLLDEANHLVGQRDARPRRPTSGWSPGEVITEAHGLFVEPGTPPGTHRLIVGLYHGETGQRLPLKANAETEEGQPKDFIELAEVDIIAPDRPLPLDAFQIQTWLNMPMGDVTLVGYDLYKLGQRSKPDVPLYPGDPVQLVVYWQARRPVHGLDDRLFIQVLTGGGQVTPLSFTRQPAGTTYPIRAWRAGEIVRAQYDFFLDNLTPGNYRLNFTLNSNVSTRRLTVVSRPFRVEQRE